MAVAEFPHPSNGIINDLHQTVALWMNKMKTTVKLIIRAIGLINDKMSGNIQNVHNYVALLSQGILQ